MSDVLSKVEDPRTALAAIRTLTVGGIAALPTDTLYGFHGLASWPGMASRICVLKGCDEDSRGFILLSDSAEMMARWAKVDDRVLAFVKQNCPGPVSFLLEALPEAPDELCTEEAGIRRLAFRIPDNSYLLHLLSLIDDFLISTSVNPSGEPPLETAAEIVMLYADKVDLVASDSSLEKRIAKEGPQASTLVDLTVDPPRILREGQVRPKLDLEPTRG
ncbi:MAG: L-threonylcarbamoyladenylate synthase [Candidatus Krumholzibacteria bacterium]|nr:L-threonylcarbamoyladenylate synthase [Candidatus Krumholzibacteria bacterium]MDP6669716.1 L-threonylcarbamoyladenylate synthase [Candidatus Krumholzibacteria bacterium]MDP6798000.1 L-threonylcarbamoyladenylate synthase [Candidatus Krumholzibacteria bacterium]MDP7021271.1 L-threonylcarbamoyladenylate synthase [Candidatus Krumholzibacteria bacterium]